MTDYTLNFSNNPNTPWFSFHENINNLVLPDGMTSIGDNAFRGCSITSVTIPNSVQTIKVSAFENCVNLTSIDIPNSVISIGNRAFYNCNKLEAVTIPNLVQSIGESAFYGCSRLIKVINQSSTPLEITSNVFYIKVVLCVPAGSVDTYRAADVWKDFFRHI